MLVNIYSTYVAYLKPSVSSLVEVGEYRTTFTMYQTLWKYLSAIPLNLIKSLKTGEACEVWYEILSIWHII